jgi:hypothetical protein
MPSIPSDMVAVVDQSDQRFWVYYVDSDGYISLYKGPEPSLKEDAENNPPYEGPRNIKLEDDTYAKASPESPKVAVVDYVPKGGVWEVIFYRTMLDFLKLTVSAIDSYLLSQREQ